jgi:hypothetical protein
MWNSKHLAPSTLLVLCSIAGAAAAAPEGRETTTSRLETWIAVSIDQRALPEFRKLDEAISKGDLKGCGRVEEGAAKADPNFPRPLAKSRKGKRMERGTFARYFYVCKSAGPEVYTAFGQAAEAAAREKVPGVRIVFQTTRVLMSTSCPYNVLCAGIVKPSSNPYYCKCP